LKCRFKFPKEIQEETRIEFEDIDNERYKVILIPKMKRNDPRINNYNRIMITVLLLSANSDIQVVLDPNALGAHYIAKYASKAETRTDTLNSAFQKIVRNLKDEDDPRQVFRKMMCKICYRKRYIWTRSMLSIIRM
jgi:hypothetical protein